MSQSKTKRQEFDASPLRGKTPVVSHGLSDKILCANRAQDRSGSDSRMADTIRSSDPLEFRTVG